MGKAATTAGSPMLNGAGVCAAGHQAAEKFPAVFAELRARLPVTGGPIDLAGASVGALPAQNPEVMRRACIRAPGKSPAADGRRFSSS